MRSRREDVLQGCVLKDQGQDCRQNSADQKLQSREQNTVHPCHKSVDRKDVKGKGDGTAEQEEVSEIDAPKSVGETKQIAPHGRYAYRDQQSHVRSFSDYDREQGDENDVQGGEKACARFGGNAVGIIGDPKLLKIRGNRQKHTAEQAAKQSRFDTVPSLWKGAFFAPCPAYEKQEEEKERTDKGTQTVKEKGRNLVSRRALCHKRQAPDQRRDTEDQAPLQIVM